MVCSNIYPSTKEGPDSLTFAFLATQHTQAAQKSKKGCVLSFDFEYGISLRLNYFNFDPNICDDCFKMLSNEN